MTAGHIGATIKEAMGHKEKSKPIWVSLNPLLTRMAGKKGEGDDCPTKRKNMETMMNAKHAVLESLDLVTFMYRDVLFRFSPHGSVTFFLTNRSPSLSSWSISSTLMKFWRMFSSLPDPKSSGIVHRGGSAAHAWDKSGSRNSSVSGNISRHAKNNTVWRWVKQV